MRQPQRGPAAALTSTSGSVDSGCAAPPGGERRWPGRAGVADMPPPGTVMQPVLIRRRVVPQDRSGPQVAEGCDAVRVSSVSAIQTFAVPRSPNLCRAFAGASSRVRRILKSLMSQGGPPTPRTSRAGVRPARWTSLLRVLVWPLSGENVRPAAKPGGTVGFHPGTLARRFHHRSAWPPPRVNHQP